MLRITPTNPYYSPPSCPDKVKNGGLLPEAAAVCLGVGAVIGSDPQILPKSCVREAITR